MMNNASTANSYTSQNALNANELQVDILPCLKSWDSYAVRLNGALRFGGFPLHWR